VGTARIPALVTVQWVGTAPGPNAATSYIVEVGNEAGVTNISQFDTGETALSTVQPAAAGTYYVRVRSVNACGKSAPSPEPVVTVTDSIAFGDAGARRIAGFYFSDSEGYVGTFGIVRGAWGARPTPFVRLDSSFQDSAGTEIGTGFGYVNGRSRRLATSRIITDTTLGSGETGCYIVFSDVPYKSVARVLTSASWNTSQLESLQGSVVTQSVQSGAGTVGEAKIQGQVRNIGTAMTYFNQVMIALYDTDNDILDCDYTFVRGSRLQAPSGVVTDSALSPDQIGDYVNFHRVYAKYLARTATWTAWEEVDSSRTAAAASVMRWQDQVGSVLETLAITSHEQRARIRADAIGRLRLLLAAQTSGSEAASVSSSTEAEVLRGGRDVTPR
jgi:hypothetical protein